MALPRRNEQTPMRRMASRVQQVDIHVRFLAVMTFSFLGMGMGEEFEGRPLAPCFVPIVPLSSPLGWLRRRRERIVL